MIGNNYFETSRSSHRRRVRRERWTRGHHIDALTISVAAVLICATFSTLCWPNQLSVVDAADNNNAPSQPISSRLAFLRAQRAAAAARQAQTSQQQQPLKNETSLKVATTTTTNEAVQNNATINRGTATQLQLNSSSLNQETTVANNKLSSNAINQQQQSASLPTPISSTTAATTAAAAAASPKQQQQQQVPSYNQQISNASSSSSNNNSRLARTADVFQNGDGFNIFVTNTCERELMHVNIRTSRPFFGVIHTRNQRKKAICSIEGDGEVEYNLDISHVLNQQDPNYCGVIKARKESPEDKDLLSVVIAVRVHRNIELSDDKFFLLNCTNRCRRADCSPQTSARLTDNLGAPLNDNSAGERENVSGDPTTTTTTNARQPGRGAGGAAEEDECTIWKFPWLITLLWCMAILLLAMIISHCIMCSSLVCRCVKTEVEEREPSVYEGATDLDDDEDSLYNKKTHPMRIDYDNKDIYKTSNNYEPYTLDDDCKDEREAKQESSNKRRHRLARR